MGSYDSGSYDSFDNPYSNAREDARQKLARLLAGREQKMQGYMAAQQYKNDTNYGDDMTRGASLGAVGGPYGALIGAGVGALAGGKKAYDARRGKGESGGKALLDTILSLPDQVGNALSSPSAAPLAGQLGAYHQQQKADEANPMNYGYSGGAKDPFGNETGQFQFSDDGQAGMSGGGHYQQHLLSPDEYEARRMRNASHSNPLDEYGIG